MNQSLTAFMCLKANQKTPESTKRWVLSANTPMKLNGLKHQWESILKAEPLWKFANECVGNAFNSNFRQLFEMNTLVLY